MVDSPGSILSDFLSMENGHVAKTLEKFPRARERGGIFEIREVAV